MLYAVETADSSYLQAVVGGEDVVEGGWGWGGRGFLRSSVGAELLIHCLIDYPSLLSYSKWNLHICSNVLAFQLSLLSFPWTSLVIIVPMLCFKA